jgi:hypothetical protein
MELIRVVDAADRNLGRGFATVLGADGVAHLTVPANVFAGIVGDSCDRWSLIGENGARYRFQYEGLVDGGSFTVAVRVRRT